MSKLISILEDVVEIFGPIRTDSHEGEMGMKVEFYISLFFACFFLILMLRNKRMNVLQNTQDEKRFTVTTIWFSVQNC